MSITHKHVGPKILGKIKMYVLTRAELFFPLCYEIPCRFLCRRFLNLFLLFPCRTYFFFIWLQEKPWVTDLSWCVTSYCRWDCTWRTTSWPPQTKETSRVKERNCKEWLARHNGWNLRDPTIQHSVATIPNLGKF